MLTKFYYALALGVCMGASANAQVLTSYTHLAHYSKQNVQTILNNFNVPAGFIRPEFDVDVYKVTYITRNASNTDTTTASGAIVVPSGVTCPLPLVSYQHGTTTERNGVPSRNSAEINLGIIFSSAGGYVSTLPDYLGLGDSRGMHPYVHAKSEATATVDILRAARQLKDSLGFNLNGQLFLFGYSQGGHATMAAFKELEELHSQEFTVTAVAPMSGPYDISGVQSQTITSGMPYSSPSYLPYVVLGYQEAYGNIYNTLSDIFVPPYDSLIPLLYDGTHGSGYINSRLPDTISQMMQPAFYQDFQNNPNNTARIALRDNDLYRWTPQAPVRLLYCHGDEQVFYQNSIVAYDSMTARGSTSVQKYDYGNYTHSGCLAFCIMDGSSFFDTYRDILGGMQVSNQATPATSRTNPDGSVTITPTGGVAPYTYAWNNGLTTATASGLTYGSYIVRVSDSRGCYSYQNAFVGMTTGIETPEATTFRLAPNPSNELVFFQPKSDLAGDFAITVRNTVGQVIYQTQRNNNQTFTIPTHTWAAGLYLVEMQHANQHYTQKLIIQH